MATTITNTDDHPIVVYQGKTYNENFYVKVLTDQNLEFDEITNPFITLDITNYDVRMQVRTSFDSAVVKLSALSTGVSPKFVKNNASGIATLTLIPTDTSTLIFSGEEAEWYYDIELAHQTLSTVLLVARGTFTIKREVTR